MSLVWVWTCCCSCCCWVCCCCCCLSFWSFWSLATVPIVTPLWSWAALVVPALAVGGTGAVWTTGMSAWRIAISHCRASSEPRPLELSFFVVLSPTDTHGKPKMIGTIRWRSVLSYYLRMSLEMPLQNATVLGAKRVSPSRYQSIRPIGELDESKSTNQDTLIPSGVKDKGNKPTYRRSSQRWQSWSQSSGWLPVSHGSWQSPQQESRTAESPCSS